EELITSAIIIDKGKIDLLPIPEEMGVPYGRRSKLKFVHLVPEAPAVNIAMDGDNIFTDLEYKNYTDYEEIPPREYTMDIEISKNNKLAISNQVNINPNKIYTFYAIGKAPNIDIIQTLDGATFLN
ncbi:MAG: DUF4397 domain-containing protein, partial [Romboutsia sp.]|uniref:DUF4397 domain-containing protein n=1 Tax=Romboutsia sp. TaxID=1965302 RepID=UPI003F370299